MVSNTPYNTPPFRPRPTPPRRQVPEAGETWFVQLARGCLVLSCHVEEVTEKTVALRQVTDLGSPEAKRAYRFKTREVEFLERVPEAEAATAEQICADLAAGRPVILKVAP